jgi:hypothetical protein
MRLREPPLRVAHTAINLVSHTVLLLHPILNPFLVVYSSSMSAARCTTTSATFPGFGLHTPAPWLRAEWVTDVVPETPRAVVRPSPWDTCEAPGSEWETDEVPETPRAKVRPSPWDTCPARPPP